MISEICCLHGNSQIVSQAGKGLELANDQGPVNQNQINCKLSGPQCPLHRRKVPSVLICFS
jgi:hypothetical protein